MDKRQYHNERPKPKAEDLKLAPKEAMRREFGKRLQEAMLNKGWNQSELARNAGIGRDNISSYIRGIAMPGPLFLNKIASALDVEPNKLLPSRAMPSVDQVVPALDVRDIGKGLAWLRINQAVAWEDAITIMNILKSDDED